MQTDITSTKDAGPGYTWIFEDGVFQVIRAAPLNCDHGISLDKPCQACKGATS